MTREKYISRMSGEETNEYYTELVGIVIQQLNHIATISAILEKPMTYRILSFANQLRLNLDSEQHSHQERAEYWENRCDGIENQYLWRP